MILKLHLTETGEPMQQPFDYKEYWEQTYQSGKTSGRGSYDVLAEFKAEVVNALIQRENITSKYPATVLLHADSWQDICPSLLLSIAKH